jgi:tRNA1Val (adenine37-N6)-methyltransferase
VISNPPFFRADSGRASPCGQLAAARHEVHCSLEQLLAAAAAGLSEGEVLLMVHSMDRIAEIERELSRKGFGALRLRGIRPLPGRPCTRVLVRATLGEGGDREELDPLEVHQQPGVYSPEMQRILGEQTDRGSDQLAL